MTNFVRHIKKNKAGFTLVEMVVVIAILGILMAITVPSFNAYIEQSKTKECKSNQDTLLLYLKAARLRDPQIEIADFLNSDEEAAKVKCPDNGTYTVSDDGSGIKCTHEGHGSVSAVNDDNSKNYDSAQDKPNLPTDEP